MMLGLIASFRRTAMGPGALQIVYKMLFRHMYSQPLFVPITTKILRLVVRARIAMTSDATAISNPVSLGTLFSEPPKPMTTCGGPDQKRPRPWAKDSERIDV